MLDLMFTYWWVVMPTAAVAAFYSARFWAERSFAKTVQNVLNEVQSGFANGDADIHSIVVAGTSVIGGETVTLYEIEATITPSNPQVEWSSADLFLYGTDADGDDDGMRIGEVRKVQRWEGSSFDSIKRGTKHQGTQRLKLSIRFAGAAGPARFNHNFACFGPVFDLPRAETEEPVTA